MRVELGAGFCGLTGVGLAVPDLFRFRNAVFDFRTLGFGVRRAEDWPVGVFLPWAYIGSPSPNNSSR